MSVETTDLLRILWVAALWWVASLLRGPLVIVIVRGHVVCVDSPVRLRAMIGCLFEFDGLLKERLVDGSDRCGERPRDSMNGSTWRGSRADSSSVWESKIKRLNREGRLIMSGRRAAMGMGFYAGAFKSWSWDPHVGGIGRWAGYWGPGSLTRSHRSNKSGLMTRRRKEVGTRGQSADWTSCRPADLQIWGTGVVT